MQGIRRALALSAALSAAAAIAGCAGGPSPAPAPPERSFEAARPDGFFGVNAQGVRPLAEDGELEALGRSLDEIAAGGIDFVRANIDWPRIEPEPPGESGHAFDLSGLDRWMEELAERRIEWRVAVMGVPTPSWAADPAAAKVCGARAFPARPADFAALAAALARRYGRGGSFWAERPGLRALPVIDYELWNEPNLGSFWCPIPDPERFAELALAGARAIRAVDPRARLTLGGLAALRSTTVDGPGDARTASLRFLRRMLAARPALAGTLDVIGVHAYGRDPTAVLDALVEQRRAVDRAGLAGKPLALNETGWYTSGAGAIPALAEPTRALYLGAVTDALARSDCGLDSLAPHTWITRELDPGDREDWYGIADPESGEPYPSAEAYIAQVLRYEGRGAAPPPSAAAKICRG